MRRLHFPHVLVLLVAFALVAAAASYIVPAGEYQRRDDEATGRRVVVSGTYHRVAAQPVSPFNAVVAIPRGAADAASVIFFVFLVGGAFAVVEKTGALTRSVNWLVHRLQNREALVIPIACIVFGAAGALMQMSEELLAFVPVLLLLSRRLGYNAIVAVAISMGAATMAAAFSPIDPFMVGIAQKVAGLPLLSGSAFRLVFLAIAMTFWIIATMHYAKRTRTEPEAYAADASEHLDRRMTAVLLMVLATFVVFVIGVMRFGWDFDQLAALFFIMGVIAGLIGGLKLNGTAEAFVEGFRSMAFAALVIGFARAIYLVLEQGRIVDTLVHALFVPIADLPPALSALGMMVAHALLHIPVPSSSGHAVLTIPILTPVSDLIGLSRQVTVLAYQYGIGVIDAAIPTNGALMAMLAAMGIPYVEWVKFFAWRFVALFGLGVVAVLIAVAIGLQ
ncbi:MAG TPA: Na+/H+ antiporter NhaC family protein [Longimicrobiales bacterium]|nr:Na+/H+ antiporter NhaC family protein [Longimicrobiales bacterium]